MLKFYNVIYIIFKAFLKQICVILFDRNVNLKEISDIKFEIHFLRDKKFSNGIKENNITVGVSSVKKETK